MTGLGGRARAAARLGGLLARAVRSTGVITPCAARGVLALARDPGALPAGPTRIIALHARATPRRLALAGARERLDHAGFDERLNRLASGLAGLGVGRGDRIALVLTNRPEGIQLPWAASRLGAVVVPLSWRATAAELAFALGHSAARVVVHEPALAPVVRAAIEMLTGEPPRAIDVEADLPAVIAAGSPRPERRPGAGEGGLIMYTSGTTGRPKGAARTLSTALYAPLLDLVARVGFTRDDRQLVVCPLYHAAPPAIAAITLGLGGALHVLEGGAIGGATDPEAILAAIARERITGVFLVPTLISRLLALPADVRRRHDTTSLRWILSGAAPLPTDTARRAEEAFGPILWNFYGATETGLVTLAGPGEHTARPGTIGRPLAGVEVRLLDDAGHDVAPGTIGALGVRSAMLASGYHDDAGATADATRAGGSFAVGDLAWQDAEGYVYLAGRAHDLVISGGVNIYPLEIEDRLHAHPDVFEAAVVGEPDPDWGEALHAFVVPRAGATLDPAELRAFCRETLAGYKVPKRVTFLSELPRNPAGKVLKRELAAPAR